MINNSEQSVSIHHVRGAHRVGVDSPEGNMRNSRSLLLIGLLSSVLTLVETPSNPAYATSLNVFAGSAPGLDIELTVKVDLGKAYFTFKNDSTGAAASTAVHEIYFEQGLSSLLTTSYSANALGTTGASFSVGATPPQPPSGNNLIPPWAGTMSLGGGTKAGFDSNGPSGNNLNVGDSWVIWFGLKYASTTAADILNAIFDPKQTSRIALHIGTCPVSGLSCSAIVTDTTGEQNIVPLPPALILFGTALVGLTTLGRRRRTT